MTAPEAPFEAVEPMEAQRPGMRRGLGVAAGSFAFSVLIGLGSSVVTSRLYGIDIIGEYALVSVPYLIVSQLSSVNEQTAFVREAAVMRRHEPRLSALFRAMLGFSTLLTSGVGLLGLVLGAVLLRGPQDRPDLVLPAAVVLGAYVLLDNTGWNIDALLSAFRAAGTLFVVRAAQVTTFLVAGVVLEWVLHSVWGLVWATVLSFAVPLLIRLVVLPRYVDLRVGLEDRRAARAELPAMVRFGAVLLPAQILSGVNQQSGTWVVGSIGSAATTGAYARSLGLASKLSEAGYRIAEILLPGLVERAATEPDSRADLLARTVRLCAVPLTVLVAAGSGAATGVLHVFGEGFDRANVVLALLLGAYALSVLSSVMSQGFLADGRPGRVTWISITASLLSLALVVPLGVTHGAGGVAFALLAGPLAQLLLLDRATGRHLGVGSSLLGPRAMAGVAVAVAGGFGVAWGIQRLGTSIGWTVLALGAGAATALVLCLAAGLVEGDERRAAVAALRNIRR